MPAFIRTIVYSVAFAIFATSAEAQELSGGRRASGGKDVAIATRAALQAQRGDARSQTVLGFMYATGRGVPQHFVNAVEWYRRAAEQGEPTAQYLLGLMYDKGQGVPQDQVLAQKWLILAAAHASGRQREYYARIRDAVAFKLSPAQIREAQDLAAAFTEVRER